MRPIDITVIPGTEVIITVPETYLHKNKCYTLELCLTKPEIQKYSTITGIEIVFIKNGVCGEQYRLIDNAGDVFYADKLLRGYEYRLRFGNNGLPEAIPHFINLNTPKCSRGYDPNNAVDGPTQGDDNP